MCVCVRESVCVCERKCVRVLEGKCACVCACVHVWSIRSDVCVCVYIYTDTYIQKKHTNIHTYTTQIVRRLVPGQSAEMYVYVCTYIHIHTYKKKHTNIHTYTTQIVRRLVPGQSAEQSGVIIPGDILTHVDGMPVTVSSCLCECFVYACVGMCVCVCARAA